MAKWKKCIGQVMGDGSGGGDWYRSFMFSPILPFPSTRMDPPSWELIRIRHFYHSRDFKDLGSSVPGNGDKDSCVLFF